MQCLSDQLFAFDFGKTDLLATDKSQYFAIAKFNRSPSCFYAFLVLSLFFCSIRQLRSLSDNSGNQAVIVEATSFPESGYPCRDYCRGREQNNYSQQNNFAPLCA